MNTRCWLFLGAMLMAIIGNNSVTTLRAAETPAAAAATADPVAGALREALGKGLERAVAQLGQKGGFLTNPAVRIPMPQQLQSVEKTLRRLRQDHLADEFVTTLNRAAEQAVPQAASVFGESLKQMTIQDARTILTGTNTAATEYFRRTSEARLREKFEPIVKQATQEAGVTSAYKQLTDRAKFASPFFKQEALDLDSYVTTKTLDGLFKVVADEEKRIRENPAARSTELLKSVFGMLKR